jgi:PAS domain S-box-containing protein
VGVDSSGLVVLVNQQVEALFGYTDEEIIGEPLESLLPERFQEVHAAHRRACLEEPISRPMRAGIELAGRRKDGSEFPAEISLSAIDADEGKLAIAAIRDVTERHLAEAARSRAEQKFERLLEFAPDAIVGVNQAGEIALVNQQAEALFGHDREQMLGQQVEILVPERFAEGHPHLRGGYLADPRMRPMGAGLELAGRRSDGSEFPAEISLSSIETDDGPLAIAAVRDLTERAESERERAMQEELDQGRRLESVGQLAGGIAHDFNNLLGVIINYAAFVAEEVPADSPARGDANEIRRAAERAAALTRQLLIFSRREVPRTEVLDLNAAVIDIEHLLRRALGERIGLETDLGPDLWTVDADPGQVEQVLVNLAVNARDAMPEGGRVRIETANVQIADDDVQSRPTIRPGPYVRMVVSDTGVGMDAEVAHRAFDPFFTTKEKGEGTGLGLATVYGIVQQAGGRIDLYSEPGNGTAVKIHLPASTASAPSAAGAAGKTPRGRGEVVLVVEDQDDVRQMTERILTGNGYAVLSAGTGAEALELCADSGRDIDLLLTDVVMPQMLGTELVEQVRTSRPDLRTILMSGYTHRALSPGTIAEQPGLAFIEKPFSREALLSKVSTLLGTDDA